MENKLERAKQVIEENLDDARYGIFDSRNIVGDRMDNIYDEDGLSIDICYHYEYFEVFGLSASDFAKLEKFYNKLLKKGD